MKKYIFCFMVLGSCISLHGFILTLVNGDNSEQYDIPEITPSTTLGTIRANIANLLGVSVPRVELMYNNQPVQYTSTLQSSGIYSASSEGNTIQYFLLAEAAVTPTSSPRENKESDQMISDKTTRS